jgi:hypothetical protein
MILEQPMKATAFLRRAVADWSALLLLVLPSWTVAQGIPGYPDHILEFDAREVVGLPPYCIYTAHFRDSIYTAPFRDNVPGGNNREESQKWQATLGDMFQHMHHYCWGLMHLHRAKFLARDAQPRNWNYGAAIHEFDYVIPKARRDFVLLPEILTKKGEALLGLGRTAQALAEFERAIELRADYWPPYAHISDYYKSMGELGKAREILEAGLARSPGAKGLQRRLNELDDEIAKRSHKQRSR